MSWGSLKNMNQSNKDTALSDYERRKIERFTFPNKKTTGYEKKGRKSVKWWCDLYDDFDPGATNRKICPLCDKFLNNGQHRVVE